jgi:hypothetical protein
MYLRFVSPLRSYKRGVEWGIFQAGFQCRDDDETPNYLRSAIIEEIDWFKKHLPSPDERYCDDGRVPKHMARICWFKCQAKDMINHAYALKFLLDEADCLISVIKTRHPGFIVYKDEYQVVAQPHIHTETHWR